MKDSELKQLTYQTKKEITEKLLETNTDAIDRLGWKPEDRLSDYIKSL